ncbi:MAG: sulfate ABC transporter substrate-binding protein [Rhodospirillales bacterium]
MVRFVTLVVVALLAVAASDVRAARADRVLLNVSYDPTSTFYHEFNEVFARAWKEKTDETVHIRMSHGASGVQARAVIDGLPADVVTLALASDIDHIAGIAGLLPKDWQSRLPDNSSPYTSTIVFVVRKGNPKAIRDWKDLASEGVSVITPNPKTSGGARWNFLAAWGYALRASGGDEEKAKQFVSQIYQSAPVLDTSARGAALSFMQRGLGDVLITWENEAFLVQEEFPTEGLQIVVPSVSILCEPPVARLDANVDKNKTRDLAEAYLRYLYSPDGQRLIAKHFYRPRKPEFADRADLARLPQLELFTVDQEFGGWDRAQAKFFANGGIFDQINTLGK